MAQSETPPPKASTTPPPPPGLYVIARSFDFLMKVAEWVLQAISWKILLIVAGTFLGMLALLPKESRFDASKGFYQMVAALVAPATWIAFLGWILLFVVLILGGGYFYWSERRVAQLGERLRQFQEAAEPGRLSSREPNRLDSYAKRRTELPSQVTEVEYLEAGAGSDNEGKKGEVNG